MFKITKVVALLMGLSVVLSSCSKDDENKPASQVTFDGTTYSLNNGTISSMEWDGAYEIDINLSNFSLADAMSGGNVPSELNTLYINIEGQSSAALEAGTYKLDDADPDSEVFMADFSYGMDATGEGGEIVDFENGTVTVAKDGESYSIEFTFTTVDGKEAKGSYKGRLDEFSFDF